MINLLPSEEKNRIELAKKEKIIFIFCFLFFYFFLCLFMVLSIINIYIDSRIEVENIFLLDAEKALEQSESKEIQSRIQEADINLKKIHSFYQNKKYYTSAIKALSEAMPEEIFLANFSAARPVSEEGILVLSMSGFAPDEDSLFSFRNNLIKKQIFKDINFTPASWVNPNNFSITLKL